VVRVMARRVCHGGERRAVQSLCAGQIEIRLVDRNHFDDGRKFREYGGDAVAPLRILGVMTVEIDSVRTQASGSAQRHGRMHGQTCALRSWRR